MRKIKSFIILVALSLAAIVSCSDPDNAIYDVFDEVSTGGTLRTLERISSDFNIFDLNSKWHIVVEEQDAQKGGLLSKVDVYVSFLDRTPGNDNSTGEVLVGTFDRSVFETGANGLPVTDIQTTFGESLAALGLEDGDYNGGDIFNFRLELVLTDGRTFSSDDVGDGIQGAYYASPFSYNAGIQCVPDVPFAGPYKIDMQDSYGDGWNGASISVVIDGVETKVTLDDGDSGSQTVNVPEGTQTLEFLFNSGDWDSEVTFQIYTPSGNLGIDTGPNPVVGVFGLNLCNE